MAFRIVIFGRTGVLGDALFDAFNVGQPTSDSNRVEVVLPPDLRSMIQNRSVSDWLREVKPNYVLNCVSLNGIRRCFENPGEAFRINSLFPRLLARDCERMDIKALHFSSEMVFDAGDRLPSPTESVNPRTVYGESKYLGEITQSPGICTIRLPLLFSIKRNNQLAWRIIDQLRGNGGAFASNDDYSTPIVVEDLAKLLCEKICSDSIAFGGNPIHCASSSRRSLVDSIRQFCRAIQIDVRDLREGPGSQFSKVEIKPKNLGLMYSEGFCLPFPGTREGFKTLGEGEIYSNYAQ